MNAIEKLKLRLNSWAVGEGADQPNRPSVRRTRWPLIFNGLALLVWGVSIGVWWTGGDQAEWGVFALTLMVLADRLTATDLQTQIAVSKMLARPQHVSLGYRVRLEDVDHVAEAKGP